MLENQRFSVDALNVPKVLNVKIKCESNKRNREVEKIMSQPNFWNRIFIKQKSDFKGKISKNESNYFNSRNC